MVKRKHNKLEEVINQTLSNYEAPNNTSDWAQMERILDAAPQSNSFSSKLKLLSVSESLKAIPKAKSVKWIFSPYFLIGLLVVCGAYFLYTFLHSSKILENTTNPTPQTTIPLTVGPETLKTVTPPILPSDVVKAENEVQQSIDTVDQTAIDENLLKSDEIAADKKENTEKKETGSLEKTEKAIADTKKDLKKEEQILKKKKAAAALATKDSIREANKKPADNSFGRNNFLLQSINVDSIKKHQVQPANDSLK